MEILFYRYGNICEPDIAEGFTSFGITVIELTREIQQKQIDMDTRIHDLVSALSSHTVSFVFSINFFPYISEICMHYQIPYVCWSVDSPVLELFSISIRNRCNRIFLFDYEQYTRISPQNPECIFYLPLCTNTDRWDQVLASISETDRKNFTSEVSFVGSLYTGKSPLNRLLLPEYERGFLHGLMEAQLKIYGYNFLEEALSKNSISALKNADPAFLKIEPAFEDTDRFVAANYHLGYALAEEERIRTLNTLAQRFPVTLFTRSPQDRLKGVLCRNGISTLSEMPKVFHLSKINLNITIKPIQSGLSLRIWDVLGCGGFLLTNYQSEIPEYFEPGKDLDCYESLEDLSSKVAYYLKHDDIRLEIAENGYRKVKQFHTYRHRLTEMIRILSSMPPLA